MAGVSRRPIPTVFCRYLINSGGCPYVMFGDPFLWVADTKPTAMRRTLGGAYYIKTHFGCD
jgi:hypothetical protein